MAERTNIPGQKRDRVGFILFLFHLAFLLLSAAVIVKIIYLSFWYELPKNIDQDFKPREIVRTIDPVRGSIYAADGRVLAVSTPKYQVEMDCRVRKDEFKNKPEEERKWQEKARDLSKGLAQIYGKYSAEEYYKSILDRRRSSKGPFKVGDPVDYSTLQKVKALPLFNEGANKGGMIVSAIDNREYPYGSLARRAIGYVRNNLGADAKSHIGIEGKFDEVLHGKPGKQWYRITDNSQFITNYNKANYDAIDGQDIYTTIDLDIQDIADKALRSQINEEMRVEGGCVIVMEVKTGAVRAMVNLSRDKDGNLGEITNYAVGTVAEPGSVMKSAALMSLLEDRKIRLCDSIPTNHGHIAGYPDDTHISEYEHRYKKNKINVMYGYSISSNYVFRKLVTDAYGSEPEKYIEKLKSFKLGEVYDFDIEGMAAPTLPNPKSAHWSKTDLGSVAIGYAMSVTPLHTVTFYNGIANRGRMMKPYLVESIRENGSTSKKFEPKVLNGSLCSKATADSITKAMKMVTEEGTAKNLKKAKCQVAGKTGTAKTMFEITAADGKKKMVYTHQGNKKYQATFVGFFPADEPKYTAIVVVYSKPSPAEFYGGGMPARTFKSIVDQVYTLDPEYGGTISGKGPMPRMKAVKTEIKEGTVPDLKGLGLSDAIYAIENSGYRCTYHGTGHVRSQSPAAGSKYGKGQTVSIELK